MALDITVFGNVDWGKFNGVVYSNTAKYTNNDTIYLLKDIFANVPMQDGKRYNIVITFEGDVVIGVKKTDQNGNDYLDGKVYVPAKSPVRFSSDFIKSALFSDSFLAFQNQSSTDPSVKPEFEISILVSSPDPML